jgi:beta-phosphoglucomutase-like phosphatase (HAD superfamily)
MQKPDAVIFDWDDTIVDTWQVVRSAINTTLEAFGHAPWSEDEARKRIGPPARSLFSGLFGGLLSRRARRDRVGAQALVAIDEQGAVALGFGEFGANLFAGFGHGRIGGQGVAGNEGGEGDGNNRQAVFHDSFLWEG